MDDFRRRIGKELKDEIPGGNFDLGYFEGRHSTKRWIVSNEDVEQMYSKHDLKGGELFLWVDLDNNYIEPPSKKRKEDNSGNAYGSRRQEKENRVEEAFYVLCEKHKDKYTKPQMKLWARMIANDLHDEYDQPPNVPLITGVISKPQKKECVSEVIAGAAAAFIKAVQTPSTLVQETSTASTIDGGSRLSPGKKTDLRMKHLQQLRYLQQLYDDAILSDSEFMEQKRCIIEGLKTL